MSSPKTDKLRATLTRALKEIERLRKKVAEGPGRGEAIAIVGIGLRMPGGVVDLAGLWRLLEARRETVGPIPKQRWDADKYYDPEPGTPGKSYVREASFVAQIDGFDPAFFAISPREARSIDPQHRLLLETSWEALENAAIVPTELGDSRTGVFVGIGPSDYGLKMHLQDALSSHSVMGTHTSFAAGRIAFTLGLQGPALSLDTACSSSLVALHLAAQSLRSGECSLALAGGVQLMVSPEPFLQLALTRAIAPDGRCKTFSAKADGFGRGEGAVVVVLERLSDARANGRSILALLRGSSVNHDGRSSGITAPNGSSQRKVIAAALADAKLEPEAVDFVECHGTGTSLGDPIEVQALADIYGSKRPPERPLLLGALKSNIGHLESAAGLAGVAKVIASLHHQTLPANLHSTPLNPHIDWEQLPVLALDAPRPWPEREDQPRRAGVSAFGLSGTNAHVILEQAAASQAPKERREDHTRPLVLLSAATSTALALQAKRLLEHLDEHPELRLDDVGYTLATGRAHHRWRACLSPTRERLRDELEALADGSPARHTTVAAARPDPRLVVMFSGQGAQHNGMGAELYERSPRFRAVLDELCAAFDPHLERSLRELMFAPPESPDAELIHATRYTQPALFAFEVALYAAYREWGLEPELLLGHSIGELSAAYVAGVFGLEDACAVVAARGRLMQALPQGGAMASIQADEAELRASIEALGLHLDVAAINSPNSTVVAGAEQACAEVMRHFSELGRKVKRLTVSHAFHSRLMEPMLEDFRTVLEGVEMCEPKLPLVSNLSGQLAAPGELITVDYWLRHVREAVRFKDAVQAFAGTGELAVLEIGPRSVLASVASASLDETADDQALVLASAHRDHGELAGVARSLGELHCHGVAVDWRAYFAASAPQHLRLPSYAFERSRCWLDFGEQRTLGEPAGRFPLAGVRIELPDERAVHQVEIGPTIQSYLEDHGVYDRIVVAGAFYVGLLLAVAESRWPGRALELQELDFLRALSFESGDEARLVTISLEPSPHDPQALEAEIASRGPDGRWHRHVSATLVEAPPSPQPPALTIPEEGWVRDQSEFSDLISSVHIYWGPRWWWLRATRVEGANVVLGRIEAPDGVAADDAPLAGALIDNAFALLFWTEAYRVDKTPRLPFAIRRVRWFAHDKPATFARLEVRATEGNSGETIADVVYYSEDGEAVAVVEGLATRLAPVDRFLPEWRPELHTLRWLPAPEAHNPAADDWVILEVCGSKDDFGLGPTGPTFQDLETLLASSETTGPVLVPCVPRDPPLGPALALLRLLQAWLAKPRLAARTLVFLTRHAVAAGPDDREFSPAAAACWGLLRSAMNERPDARLRLIDVGELDELEPPIASALADEDEPQLALRANAKLAPRFVKTRADEVEPAEFDDRATIVTGAFGGIGRALCQHLARVHGHRNFLLLSRRGPESEDAAELLAELAELGAHASVTSCDVADRDALAERLAALPDVPGAVFHLAGVVDDHVLAELDEASFRRVFAAKVLGAENLHELTKDAQLTHFVMFSSLAGSFGTAGQANYAAANAYLDLLAAKRRAQGLPAQSIAWGPWAEAGMAAQLSDRDRKRLGDMGVPMLEKSEALALFDACLRSDAGFVVGARFDLNAIARLGPSGSSLFRALVSKRGGGPRARPESTKLAELDEDQRRAHLESLVSEEVARALGSADPTSLDPSEALQNHGLDSLMAIEIRNRLQAATSLRLPATLLFDYPTISALVDLLLAELEPASAPASAPTPRRSAPVGDEDAIAIVGVSCRFPGRVHGPDDLWSLLHDGVDAISELPEDRGWPKDLYSPTPDEPGKSIAHEGGFLYDAANFDAEFFRISPQEAATIDPQHRLLLELAWESLEHAGIPPSTLHGSATGVFVGVMYHDYGGRFTNHRYSLGSHVALNSGSAVAAGRVSYHLGLEGPAFAVDTACSSSLVALHLAGQALKDRECDVALAGGVAIMATPVTFIEFSRQRAMAPDGRCKGFAAEADGPGWSEGGGLLVLKRLADALEDKDAILAVVRGSAINQDGQSQGLTAPNGPAQQRVIRSALAAAKLTPAAVDYVEAHGTGTPLGDPIEAQALQATYGREHDSDSPLLLGTIKSNLGHTQAAAGVAGVLKVVLALQNQEIPPTLHAEHPSDQIDWSGGELALTTNARSWPRSSRPRRAGVSSFGISGTNAHIIIEEAPEADLSYEHDEDSPRRAGPLSFLLSGRTEAALQAQAKKLARNLEARALPLHDLAFSLATTRDHLEHRVCVVAGEREELIDSLARFARRDPCPRCVAGQATVRGKLTFVFPGQGSQWLKMARALLEESTLFRETLEACEEALGPHTDWSLTEVLTQDDPAPLRRVDVVQPVLFSIMVALAKLWRSLGIEPDAVVGHSQGEIAAATVAGILSLGDGARIVALRSKLIRQLAGSGAMAVVGLSAQELGQTLAARGSQASIAVDNGPRSTVISGPPKAVEALVDEFAATGVFARLVRVDYASHSTHVEAVREQLIGALEGIEPASGELPFLSTVEARIMDGRELTPEYWYRNLRETVRFAESSRALFAAGHRFFVEVSPHPVLNVALQDLAAAAEASAAIVPTLRRDDGGLDRLLLAHGELHTRGFPIEPRELFGRPGQRLRLPTYAFQRQRFWLDAPNASATEKRSSSGLAFVRVDTPLAQEIIEFPLQPALLDPSGEAPSPLNPGLFLELLLVACEQSSFGPRSEIRVAKLAPLPSKTPETLRLQVVLEAVSDGRELHAKLFFGEARDNGQSTNWALVGEAELGEGSPEPDGAVAQPEEELVSRGSFIFGNAPDFEGRFELRASPSAPKCLQVSLPPPLPKHIDSYRLAPRLVDAIAQAALVLADGREGSHRVQILGWDCLRVSQAPLGSEFTLELQAHAVEGDEHRFSLRLSQGDRGSLDVEGLRLRVLEEVEEVADEDRRLAITQKLSNIARQTLGLSIASDEKISKQRGVDSLSQLAFMRSVEESFGVSLLEAFATNAEGLSLEDIAGLVLNPGHARSPRGGQVSSDPLLAKPLASESIECDAPKGYELGELEAKLWTFEDGHQVETIVCGSGPRLVLLPPLNCDWHVWLPVIAELVKSHRILAVNFPGFGHAAHGSSTLEPETLSALVAGALQALDYQPATVVGWSLGGFVAQYLAIHRPHFIERLVLVNTTACLESFQDATSGEALVAKMEADLRRSLEAQEPKRGEQLARLVYHERDQRGPNMMMKYAWLVHRHDLRERLHAVAAPTLVVAGELDDSTPSAYSELLARHIEDSKLVVVEQVGHYIPLFETESFLELIQAWVAE